MLKLADAIREGSQLTVECRSVFWEVIETDCAACAVGAAVLATIPRTQWPDIGDGALKRLQKIWPWTSGKPSAALVEAFVKQSERVLEELEKDPRFGSSIADLISNTHSVGVSRADLADLIERFEPEDSGLNVYRAHGKQHDE